MKKMLLIAVVVIGALLAYNFATTGEFTLLPQGPLSGEEQELQRLEREFETAATEFNQALRSAGLAGLDTTGDADAAMREVSSTGVTPTGAAWTRRAMTSSGSGPGPLGMAPTIPRCVAPADAANSASASFWMQHTFTFRGRPPPRGA